jgi:hypothetical protein
MHSAIHLFLIGVFMVALATLARAQSDSFNVNTPERYDRGPRQRITGPVDCVAQEGFSCPTGTQGFGGINFHCLPPLTGSFIPKNWSCGGPGWPADREPVLKTILEIFSVQDCHWMLRNSVQAQDLPMMQLLAERCSPERHVSPAVPAPLQGGV